MPSCRCTIDKPQAHWSLWPWIAEYEAWKKSTVKKKGAGRPPLYPRCQEHGNTIYKFTDKSCTLPLERKPGYNCQFRRIKEAGDFQSTPPKPQSSKRNAEAGDSKSGVSKKSKLESVRAARKGEPEPVHSQPSRLDKVSEWALKLAADMYTMRVPNERHAHHMMSEVLIAQRLNGEPESAGGWLDDFLTYKLYSKDYMNKQVCEAARRWIKERQE